ncbi:MAG: class I SAM-dependent methyltransferase [Myxococcota bacterium]
MTSAPLRTVHVACPLCGVDRPRLLSRGRDFEYATSDDEFAFQLCAGCGVAYLDPRPHASELERIYPEAYASYHFAEPRFTLRVRALLESWRARAFARRLPAKADILDAGCGGPGFLESLRRLGRPGWTLWGNDVSGRVLADLERRGFRTLPGRFEEIGDSAAGFDAIFFKQVIEHLEDPKAVIANAARLLRPGGLLVLETPNLDAWDARCFRERHWGGYHFPRHWTLFTPRTLAEQGRAIGFELESTAFLLSPTNWVQSVHHRLLDEGRPAWLYNRFTHMNPLALGAAVLVDLVQRAVAGRTSNMRIVFRKPSEKR